MVRAESSRGKSGWLHNEVFVAVQSGLCQFLIDTRSGPPLGVIPTQRFVKNLDILASLSA